MASKVVNSSFVLLRMFGASRQESASKTATSHIRKTLPFNHYPSPLYNNGFVLTGLHLQLSIIAGCPAAQTADRYVT